MALNVWQPEVIRGRQKQIVEQSAVPVESRVHSLEMELKLCRQRISGFDKASVSFDLSLCSSQCISLVEIESFFPYSSNHFHAELREAETRDGNGTVGVLEISSITRS